MSKIPPKTESKDITIVKPGDSDMRAEHVREFGFDLFDPEFVALAEEIGSKYLELVRAGANPEDWMIAVGEDLIKPEWEKIYPFERLYLNGHFIKVIKVPVEGAVAFVRPKK